MCVWGGGGEGEGEGVCMCKEEGGQTVVCVWGAWVTLHTWLLECFQKIACSSHCIALHLQVCKFLTVSLCTLVL